MSSDFAIKVENLSKCYQIYDKPRDRLLQGIMPHLQHFIGKEPKQYCRDFWALKDVSFEVKKGETVGIIGKNGSGKSTLLQMICGTLTPTNGSIQTNGRVAALLELGAGFNPEFTGRENVYMNSAIMGLNKEEIDERFGDIVAFADIGDFIEQPVKKYSSGMFARLAFSSAIHLNPDILIVDEILAVGDSEFQQKCIQRFYKLRDSGCTILLVSHDAFQIRSVCTKSLFLDRGKQIEYDCPEKIFHTYNTTNANFDSGTLKSIRSKLANIVDIQLFNSNGVVCTSINSGESVELRVNFDIYDLNQIDSVTIAVNLYRADGIYVFGTTSLMQGQKAFIVSKNNDMRILVSNLRLLSGVYHWRVAINPATELGVLAEANPICQFKVCDDFKAVGLIEFDIEWSVGELKHGKM